MAVELRSWPLFNLCPLDNEIVYVQCVYFSSCGNVLDQVNTLRAFSSCTLDQCVYLHTQWPEDHKNKEECMVKMQPSSGRLSLLFYSSISAFGRLGYLFGCRRFVLQWHARDFTKLGDGSRHSNPNIFFCHMEEDDSQWTSWQQQKDSDWDSWDELQELTTWGVVSTRDAFTFAACLAQPYHIQWRLFMYYYEYQYITSTFMIVCMHLSVLGCMDPGSLGKMRHSWTRK